jgi:HSP20 family protein
MNLTKLTRRHEGVAIQPLDRFFDDFLAEGSLWNTPGFGTGWVPAVDVEETENSYLIRAEIPGLKKEDVKLSLTENVLTISGEKKAEVENQNKKYHRLERTYGAFQRSFSLPEPIQADKIEASFRDGLLEVAIPKSEKAKPRNIDIKVH